MKRVEIDYMGKTYTLPNTTAEQVRTEIAEGISVGKPFWLHVNFGEGKPQEVALLLAPGIGITVADTNVDEETGDIQPARALFDNETHTSPTHDNADA